MSPHTPRRDATPHSPMDATRRQVLHTLGAGAVALGGSAALGGTAAAQEPGAPPDPVVEGVEEWTFTRERVDAAEVEDGPTVTYDDEEEEVVVTGGYVFGRTGCDTFVPQRIYYSDEHSRLGVIVDAVPTYTPEDEPVACADALMPLRYELRVSTESFTRETVVEEAFTDDGRSMHPRSPRERIDLPPSVEDYEFAVGPEVGPDDAEVLTPAHADETEPSVTFDGDDVVVEGAITYGSSGCDEVALTRLGRRYVDGHVGAEVEARPQADWMPGDGCTGDVAATYYRLELTGSGEPPLERCSVRETGVDAAHELTVEERDADLELPDGVTDHRLAIDHENGDYHDRESDPVVTFEPDAEGDGGTVVVEGTTSGGSSTCNTLAVGELRWAEDGHLLARVDTVQREGMEVCTADVVTVDYRLELSVEELPGAVTAQEGSEGEDEPHRSVTVERYGVSPHELPEGVSGYDLALGGGEQDAVEDAPSVVLPESTDEPVVIEGTLLEGPCERTVVADVRWAADGHLAVAVDAVTVEESLDERGQCPIGAPATPRSYTVELSVDELPAAVTAEEDLEGGEPLRSTRVEREARQCPNPAEVDGHPVCDLDGDGLYRDVTGDVQLGQDDVVTFFENQHREAWQDPELFDFSENGSVGHGDVIALFESVATA